MPYFCLEKIERALNDERKAVRGARILVARRLLQGRRRRPARVAGAQDHEPARTTAAPSSSYHDPFVPELPDLGLEHTADWPPRWTDIDLAVIVTAHPGVDHEAVVDAAPRVLDLRGITRKLPRLAHVEQL